MFDTEITGMGGLRAAVESLRGEDLDWRPAGLLADDLVELELVSGLLELERARRVAAFEAKQGQDLEGHSSVTAFLKHRCRMTGGRAQRIVGLARKLPGLPFVEKAATSGDIFLDQARVLLDVPDHLLDALAKDEVTLVNAVGDLSVSDTRRVVDYWRAAVDGPGTEAAVEELYEQRYLYASRTMGGMVKGDFLLDPLAGEVVLEALVAVIPPRRDGDERTPCQRRGDGLSDLARSFLDRGGSRGGETASDGVDRP